MENNSIIISLNCDVTDGHNCTSNFSIIENISAKLTHEEKIYPIHTLWVVVLFIAYSAIFVIALVGNVLVLWLVLASKRMRTLTNILICNLAAADIIISIFTVPFHFQAALFQRWNLPHFLCPICPFTQELSVLVSVFTLAAIALQRYGAVVHPLRINTAKWTSSIVVVLIWLVAISIATPTYMDFTVKMYRSGNPNELIPFCQSKYLSRTAKWYYNQCLVFAQYVLPLLIISLAYYKTSKNLWSAETPGNLEENRDAVILEKKKKVTKMMVTVVVMFAICWLPYQAYNFFQIHFPGINDFYYINIIWLWIHWLAMSNSCVNPFIYAILNEKFKDEFKRRWRHRRGNDSEEPTNNQNIAMLVQNVQILEQLAHN